MTRLEDQKRDLEQELQTLESDPDSLALVHAEEARKKISQVKMKIFDLNFALKREAEKNKPPVDPRIDAAINQLVAERERCGKLIVNEGLVERGPFGNGRGYIDSNEAKIRKHLETL